MLPLSARAGRRMGALELGAKAISGLRRDASAEDRLGRRWEWGFRLREHRHRLKRWRRATDQSVKTPTKPAVRRGIPVVVITSASFRFGATITVAGDTPGMQA
jgi:hypothetical protein